MSEDWYKQFINVIENPITGIFRNVESDPSIIPNQMKVNTKLLMFISGVCLFLNISNIIENRVIPINKSYSEISQVIDGCLFI